MHVHRVGAALRPSRLGTTLVRVRVRIGVGVGGEGEGEGAGEREREREGEGEGERIAAVIHLKRLGLGSGLE